MTFRASKGDPISGTSRATAVAVMVGVGLGVLVLVGGVAALVSAADASPLAVAAAAALTAGTGGYLLALASKTVRRRREERKAEHERAIAIEQSPTAWLVKAAGQELAVLDLGDAVSSALRKKLSQQLLETGRPFRSGGPLAPEGLLLAGIAPVIARHLRAGNVFVLSDQAGLLRRGTLMKLGEGFGAAVHGPSGKFVGAVKFVPAAGFPPTAAPVLLFTAVTAIVMAVRFERIEQRLRRMSAALEVLVKDKLSEDVARFLSASERLSDIHAEYFGGSGFTDEMKMRLALVERDANILRHKHHALATAEVSNVLAAKLSENEKRLFVAASIADAQVDQLRLLLALQNNPSDADRRCSALRKKVEMYTDAFRSLAENSPAEKYKAKLLESIAEMGFLAKLLKQDKAIQTEIRELEGQGTPVTSEERRDDNQASDEAANRYSILVWREDNGAGELKAWYTNDYALAAHAAPAPSPEAHGPGAQAAES